MKLRPKNFFFVMVGLTVIFAVLLVSSALGGKILMQKQGAKLSELRTQTKVVDEQEVALARAKKDIDKYSELDKIAKSIVPQDKDQAKTIREITAIAAQNDIELKAITFTTSNLGQATTAPAQKPASGTPAAPSTSISQVKPVDGIAGVYAQEIIISPVDDKPVPYYKFLNFLEGLEANRRTAHVDKITVTPTEKSSSGVKFTLTLNSYIRP